MNIDTYPLIIGETSMVYEFISEGINGRIGKIVVYSETNLHNFYNLGFGDRDSETGSIDDLVITTNGDSQKVLATVASSLVHFTDLFPNAIVYAAGSTRSRTRLYQIGIKNNLEMIRVRFGIFGQNEKEWEPFKKGIDYNAFIVKRKN